MKSDYRANECHIAIDVETTGLSPRFGGRIIEIAAVIMSADGFGAEFQTLINPGVNVPVAAKRVNGISTAMLRNKPEPPDVFPEFKEFIGGHTLLAHNAAFDMGFLRSEFLRLNMETHNPNICTLKMSRKLLPGLPDYKLATVYRHLFGCLPREARHRALTDAKMAGRIWLELTKRGNKHA
ncbi:hypothetical protein MNBD_DELTA03-208 [hydrothermal vent metagenome]|uniref:Exonuclease domain-containing protein n=1 Tax=hydrothermal vent metagenome TaxID=652676 RepID=A0A3B0V571_9ZZZZ